MTVYNPTLQPVFTWPARKGLRLRLSRRVMRGIVRAVCILLLALIFFLMSVETVVAWRW